MSEKVQVCLVLYCKQHQPGLAQISVFFKAIAVRDQSLIKSLNQPQKAHLTANPESSQLYM
jgi:hypothetical protein